MGLLLALPIVIIVLLVLWYKYTQNYWLRRGIPHNKPSGAYGNLRSDAHWSTSFVEVYNKFKGTGPFAGFYMFSAKAVLVLEPELVKNVLIKDFNNFEDRGLYHNEVDDPLTGNLFFLDGDKWRQLRQKITPTFTSGKMKWMFSTVVKVGKEFEAVMIEKLSSGPQTLEVTDFLGRFTADVIGACAFGIECNSLRNPVAEFAIIGRRFFNEPRHSRVVEGFIHGFPKWARRLHMRVINQSVHDFYMGIVKETIAYRERTGTKRKDFMDLLLELKNGTNEHDGLTVEEIAAQAFVFFIAGFETSSTTMGFALYELAQNQDIQDKVRADIIETLARYNNELTYDCMQDMKYLEQVINETLRKYPVAPHLVRKAKTHYETWVPKYYIEPGTSVLIPVLGIHNDPKYYPEPEKFKPERFTPEEIQKRPQFTYLPFGDGPRNCIGLRFGKMQATIGLAYLLKNFRFSVAPETQIPYKLVIQNILLSPENGIYLRVEKI